MNAVFKRQHACPINQSLGEMRPKPGKGRLRAYRRFVSCRGRLGGNFPALWRRQCGTSHQVSNFGLKSALDSNHPCRGLEVWGRVRLFVWGLAMLPAQPLHGTHERLEGTPFGRDDDTFDECADDDVVSLLEENARLRKLVVRLSEIVLRNVADGK
jgi:hypothetical protein